MRHDKYVLHYISDWGCICSNLRCHASHRESGSWEDAGLSYVAQISVSDTEVLNPTSSCLASQTHPLGKKEVSACNGFDSFMICLCPDHAMM